LKDIASARKAVGQTIDIEPNIVVLEKRLAEKGEI